MLLNRFDIDISMGARRVSLSCVLNWHVRIPLGTPAL